MAQMVAKAMAKTDVSAADKALIDKLAAEFSDELNNLGVRVSNLERNADMVKWNGQARYRYWSQRYENQKKQNKDQLTFRFEPTAEVNANWHVKARIDASADPSEDGSANMAVKRIWAQGDYRNFQVKLGKLPLASTETAGMLFDDQFSGAQLTFGNKLKATLEAGRWNLANGANAQSAIKKAANDTDDAANYQGIMLNGTTGKLYGGAAYRHFSSAAFTQINDDASSDDANLWSVGAGYKFDHNWDLSGAYAKNTEAATDATAHNIQLNYKGAQKANKGSWGAYTAYRYMGQNVAFAPLYEMFLTDSGMNNVKGWEVGAEYIPFTNVLSKIQYFNGKKLDSDRDAEGLFGQVNFFF